MNESLKSFAHSACTAKFLKLIAVIFLLTPFSLSSQDRAKKGEREGGSKGPTIGKIYGKVVDYHTKKPVEYATVALYSKRDSSLVTGTVSGKDGRFLLNELRRGRYYVVIDFIGYKPHKKSDIGINPSTGQEIDLGMITLEQDLTMLKAAEVVEDTKQMELLMDRKVFHVDNNVNNSGASASEVLQNIPSVEVDIDGAVSLRGNSNVNVLIDGRPSGLTGSSRDAILDQIPADAIDRVELITNPSAKFDPDGTAGIINIILKKNKLEGFQGSVKLSVSPGMQQSASLGLSRRTEKSNIYGQYSYRYNDQFSWKESDRLTYFTDSTYRQDQSSDGSRIRQSHTVKLGADFFLNQKNTLSIAGLYSPRIGTSSDSLLTNITNDDAQVENYRRDNEGKDLSGSYDLNLSYQRKFGSKDNNLVAEVSGTRRLGSKDQLYFQNEFDEDLLLIGDSAFVETQYSNNVNQTYIGLIDFTWASKTGNTKLETGWKSTLRAMDTDLNAFDGSSIQALQNDTNRSNHFIYNEDVHAIYAVLGQKLNKFSLSAGLRAEQAFTTSELVTTDETFKNNYFKLFPSGHLNYELTDNNQVQISYSKRINRPRTRNLNPFPNYSDPLNIRRGNPFLLPEVVDSYELTWMNTPKWGTISSSVYYRQVHDIIRSVRKVDEFGVATSQSQNLASMKNWGVELVTAGKLASWWTFNLSGNFYYSASDGSNLASELNSEGWSWNTKLNSIWKWGDGWNLQYSAQYRAPYVHLQGSLASIFYMDLGGKKSILKDRGSIGIRVSDILNSRQMSFTSSGTNFDQDVTRKRESRNVYVTFSLNFGKLEQRQKRGSRGNSGGGGGDFEVEEL
ncbi:MAG: iron complex outermembrane receptor protein [Flavobacteriales bacterium]|jgi:iron complex outermembrane receptor protein